MRVIKRFDIYPNEIIIRLHDDWLPAIRNGEKTISKIVIPYLESQAIERFKSEFGVILDHEPSQKNNDEEWRLFWINEARQACTSFEPVASAGSHLTFEGAAAVNMLMAASELRYAIEQKKTEEIAALTMLLVCEAINGGLVLDFYDSEIKAKKLTDSRQKAYKTGAGKYNADIEKAKISAIAYASKEWTTNPKKRIGEVSKEIEKKIYDLPEHFSAQAADVQSKTIKIWLKKAAKEGKLVIPPEAQKGGRPKKIKTISA